MNQTKPLPIDTILMLVLGTVYVSGVNEALGAFLMLPVGSYIILDTLSRSNILRVSPGKLFDTKFALVMLTVFLVVVLPTVSWMMIRQATNPWQHIIDGGLQTEEAIKYLLQGKNPYTEDYIGTPLVNWFHPIEGVEENPALYHNVYLPFSFLFSVPFYLVVKNVTGWYDQRLVYLLLFICTL